jgi:hypothetical protein
VSLCSVTRDIIGVSSVPRVKEICPFEREEKLACSPYKDRRKGLLKEQCN